VREDVSAVLFDEPLTVIDPHLKWQLRRKLKQIHHELKLTLIYVTHDQIEALTFADLVVVMTRGKAVQIGTASQLFERPQHTFVGNFIGSPGMNFLPAQRVGERVQVAGHTLAAPAGVPRDRERFTLGVRPEYVTLADPGAAGAVTANVLQVQDIGTYWLVSASVGTGAAQSVVRMRLAVGQAVPAVGQRIGLTLIGPHTCFYADDILIEGAKA
jgi:glycerol transport system ATP-binding protein